MSTKHPSPLKAIRLKCLDCGLDQAREVRLCCATGCPLYPLRLGKSVPGVRPLTAIVEKCRDCSPAEQPKTCDLETCALWVFREGRNINRKGIGNHSPNQANLVQNSRTQEPIQERTLCESSTCPCEGSCAACTCSDGGRE